jgi:RNA polymerase sigma factor (sigma-70 family)
MRAPADLLPATSDEALAMLANEGDGAAVAELLQRYYGWTASLVARYARRWQLRRVDIEDAQQDCVFWILEAVRRYGAARSKTRLCRFHSFAHFVVTSRLRDAGRRARRYARREFHSIGGFDASSQTSRPDVAAQRRETLVRLRGVLNRLDRSDRQLWQLLVDHVPMSRVARELHIPYHLARRRRRALFRRVRKEMKESA